MKSKYENKSLDAFLAELDQREHERLAKHEIRGSDLMIVLAWLLFAGTLLGFLVWSAMGAP